MNVLVCNSIMQELSLLS